MLVISFTLITEQCKVFVLLQIKAIIFVFVETFITLNLVFTLIEFRWPSIKGYKWILVSRLENLFDKLMALLWELLFNLLTELLWEQKLKCSQMFDLSAVSISIVKQILFTQIELNFEGVLWVNNWNDAESFKVGNQ